MKKLICLILALVMLAVLASCGGKSETKDGDPEVSGQSGAGESSGLSSDAVDSYAKAYTFYSGIIESMSTVVGDAVDANNTKIEEANPDGYYSDPSYMILMYTPFLSIDLAFTATFDESTDESAIAAGFEILGLEDVKYNHVSKNNYELSYTTDDGAGNSYKVKMTGSYNPDNMGLEFVEYSDESGSEKVTEFYEFISLGGDRYALQSNTARAIVTYKDGVVTQIHHTANLYDYGTGEGGLPEDKPQYDITKVSIIDKKSLDDSWVSEFMDDDMLGAVYELVGNKLTVTNLDIETEYSDSFEAIGRTYTWKAPVEIEIG